MATATHTAPTENVRHGRLAGCAVNSQWNATLHRLAALRDSELESVNLAALNLWTAIGLPGAEELDMEACLRTLAAWTDLVRANTEHWWPAYLRSPESYEHSPGRFRMMALVTVLQRDLGLRYHLPFSQGEYDARDSRNLFLHGPLTGHGGTCVTMPVLYVSLGRALGYPLAIAQAKEHLFARWDDPDGERFNIECTCLGFRAPDDAHYHWSPRPLTEQDLASGQFLRNLSPRAVLALFLKERGQCLMDHLRLGESLEALYYANRLAPDLPGAACAWATATVLYRGIEEAKRKAHRAGHTHVDLTNLPLPPIPGHVGNWLGRNARKHLERIIKNHFRNSVPPHHRLFEDLATGSNPFYEGVTSCTIQPSAAG